MRVVSETTYRRNIKENVALLEAAIESGNYPNLTELLNAYGKSLYRKLCALLDYFGSYGRDIKQRMSYHDGRGWEMMLSYDTMTALGAGTDKATWEKAVLKLATLDLLRMFRPRTADEYRDMNTSVQQLSAERAIEATRKPVTWYHVPKYTKQRLKAAEELAKVVKAGAAVDKDSLRDELGAKQANRITDTGYDIHTKTKVRRTYLKIALEWQLIRFHFTTTEAVLDDLCGKEAYLVFGNRKQYEKTWKAYKPLLFADLGLKEGRPSKEEKEKWGIVGDRWIIRRIDGT